jgi:hypothetical protein
MKKLLLIFLLGWMAQVSGQTCPPVAVPFLEPFSTGALPGCWVNQNPTSTSTSANAKWKFSGAPGYGTTNNGKPVGTYAWVDASVPYDNEHTVELISPQINLTGLTAPFVQFEWFKNHLTSATGTLPPYDNNELKLHVNDGTGWVQIWTNSSNLDEWRTVGIPLAASYVGATIQLRFTVDKNAGTNPYFYDDVLLDHVQVLQAPTCFVPTLLPPSNVTPTGATISWTPPATAPAQGYEYYYSTVNTPPTAATVGTSIAGTTANITPLVAGTTYYWWVRSVCSPTDMTAWVPGDPFTPGQIGSGTSSQGFLPIYSCYGYNYSQQIYTAAELTAAIGTNTVISKIRFFVSSTTTQSNYNEWVVFMGNTTKTNFATTTDWVPYSQLSEVYSGTLANMTSGTWVEITLNTPFVWDGTSNLVIAVDENSSGYSCTANWGSYTAGTNRGILYRNDVTNPDPVSPPSATARYSVIPQLQIVSEPMAACTANPPATVNVSGITTTTANLSWSPAQGATYVVQWRPVTTPASAWTTVTPAPTSSSYLLQGLQETTQYEFQVAYNCSGTVGAFGGPVQFTTPALTYCTSNPTSTSAYEFISNVTVNGVGTPTMISNSTGTGQAYTDYTNDPTRLVQLVIGTSGNSVSVSKEWLGFQYNAGTGVWIDFNRNGTFETSERVLNSPSNTTTPVSQTFAVPMPPLSYTGPLKTRMRVVLQEGGNPNACGTFTWGEVEDYDVQLITPPACSAAAPTNLTASNITNTTANLTWMPATGATYVLQWRAVGSPTWTTVTPALTVSAHTLTGLMEQTQYEFRVAYVCGTVQGAFATPVQFTTVAMPYCAANPTNTTLRTYISNVSVNAIGAPAMVSTSTGAAQYTDYTGDPSRQVTLIIGTPGNTVSVTKAWTGTTYAAGTGVWIDFNRNGTFEANERVLTSASNTTNPVTATFTVPTWSYTGPLKTRMRVIVREAGNPTACGTFTYGEVEDYDVKLVEPIPCTSAAPQGLDASNLGPTSATLSWMPATGATYVLEWREVTTPASPWITVTPAPVFSYHILNNLEEQTTYEFRVRYVCNGVPGAFSAPYQFTTPPLIWCTAGSTSTPLDEHITNVTVTSTGFPIAPPMVSNSGPSNYTDYYFDPTRIVTLVLGETGTISVSKGWVDVPSNIAISAWVDYNRNGVFETTEQILNSAGNQTTPITDTFLIPLIGNTSPYPTKMRVVARLTSAASACGTFDFGEVEDYPVVLVEPIPCNSAPPMNVTVTGLTHNSATVNWTPDPGGATYIVQYKPVGAATWTGQIPITFLTGTYTIPNLIPATQYIVQVVALCDNIPGTPAEVPFETKCDPEPPTNLLVSAITTTSAMVTWDPVATAVYVLQYREVGTTTWTTVNVTGTSFAMTGLTPYTTYEVQVASECSGAINPYTTPAVFTTLPTCEMAPVGLTVTNITMTQAQVDWNAYPGATYVFRWRKVGSSGWTTLNLTTNTYIITGLTEETQYEVQVANICNGATQQFTHPYVFTTPSLVYCDMSAASSSAEHISNVNVKPAGGTEMNNDSGASGYTSYLADPTKHIVLLQGSTGNQISISKEWANTQYNEAVTVWIDFNRNGVFSNNERILIAPANQQTPVTTTFSVPADAYVSLTNDRYVVMRVAMSRNGSPEMCSTFANGEVEDYRVRITKAMPNNIMDNNQIIVYPNPAKNTLFITKVKDGAKYKVYSAIGQLVQTGTILSNKIDVSRLINGIFVIDITDTNGESAQKKFIKE